MMDKLTKLVEMWIFKANNDLKAVEVLFKEDEVLYDAVCFHCQQSAEKYLKAYLVSKNRDPEKTHIIGYLLNICIGFDKSFSELIDAGILTYYAVEGRYPGDFYFPSKEEADTAYFLALKVKEFVLKIINTDS